MSDRAITEDLTQRVLTKFSDDRGWCSIREASLGRRRADVVAAAIYKSKRWSIHGFEVKASRGDWLKEIQDPSKADELIEYLDAWWVVTPKGIVKDGELPTGWGLLEVSGRGLRMKVKASEPGALGQVDRELFIRFILKLLWTHRGDLRDLEDAHRKELLEKVDERVSKVDGGERDSLRRKADEYRQTIDRFEEVSGIRIDSWNLGDVGRAVALLRQLLIGQQSTRTIDQVVRHAKGLVERCHDLREELATLKVLKPQPSATETEEVQPKCDT